MLLLIGSCLHTLPMQSLESSIFCFHIIKLNVPLHWLFLFTVIVFCSPPSLGGQKLNSTEWKDPSAQKEEMWGKIIVNISLLNNFFQMNVSVSYVCLEFSQLFVETNLADSRNEPMIFARLRLTTPTNVFPRFTLSGRTNLLFPASASYQSPSKPTRNPRLCAHATRVRTTSKSRL